MSRNVNGIHTVISSIFQSAFNKYAKTYRPKGIAEAKKRKDIVVVMHLRRGDILGEGNNRPLVERIVSFTVYISILNAIVEARKEAISSIHATDLVSRKRQWIASRPLTVFALCEGVSNNHTILEISIPTHSAYEVDTRQFNIPGISTFEVIPEKNILEAFTAMCDADVLITSPSAFSFLPAALCNPKLTIALPLFYGFSYENLNNVLSVTPLNGSLHMTGSNVRVEKMKEGWTKMLDTFASETRD